MTAAAKSAVSAVVLAIASLGGAQAAVLDLGLHGANVFSFTDFKAQSADVEGAIMAGRDVQLNNYSVNYNNVDAIGSYSLIAGGNLKFTSGSIKNGDTYVGGTTSVTKQVDMYSPVKTGTAPINLGALSTQLKSTSSSLSKLATTGSAAVQWGGLNITGSKKAVEVIDIDAKSLSSVTYFNFSNLNAGSTLIFNVSGDKASFNGGYQGFENYNVLFNFYQATDLGVHTGLTANILAPKASVTGGSGVINGNVIVDSWSSSVQINANHFFKSINVQGFGSVSAVPEPETYAMLLAGLGLMGFIARRRKQAAAR
ncbi:MULTISPECIES: choice-of-anchor A family protein [Duganella]|uniref:choice-of-anchor A family protein n=1 Tax=Duganella TaxID=75654 RepID=UPI0030E9F916